MSNSPTQRKQRKRSPVRRCFLLLTLSLFVIISVGFMWCVRQTENLIARQDNIRGRLLVDNVLIQTHWPIWANSDGLDVVVRAQSADLNHQDFAWKFFRAGNSDSESDRLDPLEASIRDLFLSSAPEHRGPYAAPFFERVVDDPPRYEYYQPVYATRETCVKCHRQTAGQPNLALNDLIAIAKIEFSNERTQDEQRKSRAMLITIKIITSAIAIIAAFMIVRATVIRPPTRQQGVEKQGDSP